MLPFVFYYKKWRNRREEQFWRIEEFTNKYFIKNAIEASESMYKEIFESNEKDDMILE